MSRSPFRLAALLVAVALLAGCTPAADPEPEPAADIPLVDDAGPDADFVDAASGAPTIVDGDDWTLPPWVRPAQNSGFFSEDASVDDRVLVRSVDVSWRQIQPAEGAPIDRASTGSAQGLDFASLDDQLGPVDGDQASGAFWMRVFASGEDWAPEWVAADCGVDTYGPDYDGQRHLPIWNECVWGHLMDTYRTLFVDDGLASDPRLRFVYVPGAFTWAEYDYETITSAVDAGDLDLGGYLSWYDHAWSDLVTLFGDDADKLVFTGEDYPFGPFGDADDLLTAQAVATGMGVRTGITEVSNFHLSEAPSYGSRIEPDGHLTVDETLPVHDGRHIAATENECYTDCGYDTDDPYYAVRQSNLKALQLRMNWIYVVPEPSYFAQYPEHWDWVRLSMGQTADTSADAWAELRDAEDTYWRDEEFPREWGDKPWVRNLERWLLQVDEPGSVAHRTDVDVHENVLEPDNGAAHEGLSTDVAAGDTGFVLEIDDRFVAAAAGSRSVVKVTYRDAGTGAFSVDAASGSVALTGSGEWKTATLAVSPDTVASGRLRIALADGSDDLVVRFVRLVRSPR